MEPHEEPEHPGEAGPGEEGDLLEDFPGLKKLVDDLVEQGIRKYERVPKDDLGRAYLSAQRLVSLLRSLAIGFDGQVGPPLAHDEARSQEVARFLADMYLLKAALQVLERVPDAVCREVRRARDRNPATSGGSAHDRVRALAEALVGALEHAGNRTTGFYQQVLAAVVEPHVELLDVPCGDRPRAADILSELEREHVLARRARAER